MEHLVEAKRILANYCSSYTEFCEKYIELISEISKLVAKARMEDLVWSAEYTGIDSGVFELLRKIVDMYAEYIAGFYLTSEDRVAVRIVRDVRFGNTVLEKGEIIFLPVREAIALSIADIAEPLRSNLIRLQRLKTKR
jgi:hypothetical protein